MTYVDGPYKGLVPYEESDADYFFGREQDTDVIVANMIASRLTLLYGPSGVGKSSVLHAGVMRRMGELAAESARLRGWPDIVAVAFGGWRDDPLLGLSAAVGQRLQQEFGDAVSDFPVTAAINIDVLAHWTERLDIDLVIVLDQFEEYFVYHEGEGITAGFAAEWSRALRTPGLRVNFLLAIREDALAQLDRFEGYVPGLFDNYIRLDYLSASAARDAIERPLERYNDRVPLDDAMQVEPAFVTALIAQTRSGKVRVSDAGTGESSTGDTGTGAVTDHDRIETPYLQLVLTRLWNEEVAAGSSALKLATLERLGGAQHIVRSHLDNVMAQLPDDRRQVAARVFRQMVTPSGTKIAYTCSDLAAYTGVDAPSLHALLEELSSSRLRILRPVPPPLSQPGETRYEVFHDILALAVVDWCVRYDAESRRWESERRLVAERHAAEQVARDARRRTRRVSAVAIGMSLLLVATVVLALVSVAAQKRAQRQTNALGKRTTALNEQTLLSAAASELGKDPAKSLHTALQAWRMGHTSSAEQAVRVALSASPLRAVLRGHRGPVVSAAFSPNGGTVLTAGEDGTARLWDATTGHQQRVWRTNGQRITGASFSADGRYVAAGTVDGTVWMWEVSDGRQIVRQGGQGRYVTVSWAAAGSLLISVAPGSSAKVSVWDAADPGHPIATVGEHLPVWGAGLSADGAQVVTAENDNRLRVWQVSAPGQPVATSAPAGTVLLLPRFSPVTSSGLIAAAQTDGKLVTWMTSAAAVTVLKTHIHQNVSSLSFRDDGRFVLMAGDKVAEVIAPTTGNEQVMSGHTDWVTTAAYSPDWVYIGTASEDGTAQIWNEWSSVRSLVRLVPQPGGATSIAFDRSGLRVVTANGDGTARVWSLWRDHELRTGCWALATRLSADARHAVSATYCADDRHDGQAAVWRVDPGASDPNAPRADMTSVNTFNIRDLQGVAISPDGRYIVTNTLYSGDLEERDVIDKSGEVVRTFHGGADSIEMPAFNATGTRIVAGGAHNDLFVWDASSGTQLLHVQGEPAGDDFSLDASFSPDSTVVMAASTDGTVRVWDASSGHLRASLTHPARVTDARFDRSGRYIVTASADGKVRVWDRGSRSTKPVVTLDAGVADLSSAAFGGPHGEWVAAGASDGAVRIWNWRDGEQLAAMPRHGDLVNDLTFTSDGLQVISSGDDGAVRMYGCDTCGNAADLISSAERVDAAAGPQ